MDKARELVSNPVLWPRVRDFLWDFAPQIHRSWIEGLKVEGLTSGLQTLGIRRFSNSPRVKRFILSSLGVEPCFHAFPRDDGSRLALLDGSTLLEIAKWLGALACAEELRKITDGKTVRSLKAALPGVYPEVFGFTEYFRKLKVEKLKFEKFDAGGIVAEGASILCAAVANLPKELFRRLELKLPHDLQPSDLQPSDLQPSTLQLLMKLLKLRYPEAHSLCCS